MTAADRAAARGMSLDGRRHRASRVVQRPSLHPSRGRAFDVSAPTQIVSSRPLPEIRATPATGCDVCGALATQYGESQDRDLLIEINNHPHTEPKLSRVRTMLSEGATVG